MAIPAAETESLVSHSTGQKRDGRLFPSVQDAFACALLHGSVKVLVVAQNVIGVVAVAVANLRVGAATQQQFDKFGRIVVFKANSSGVSPCSF